MIREQALSLAKEFGQKAAALEGKVLISIKEESYSFSVNLTKGADKFKVIYFFGKKGIKIVQQGDTNTLLFRTIAPLLNNDTGDSAPALSDEPAEYIGTDESGKGDYFGPLIVAGVGVDKITAAKLKQIGVKDSKLLSDNEMAAMYPKIIETVGDRYNIISINPQKYNELYAKIHNLNRLLAWGHAKAIENILSKHPVPEVISDKFGDESYIQNSLQNLGKQIKLHQVVRAEKYTAVAAASILARHTFASWFRGSEARFGYNLKKGASKEVEALAGKLIKEKGMEFLNTVAKVHFKTTQQAQTLF